MPWIQILDVVFFTLLLRFLIGWLFANRQVARFMLTLLSLAIFVIIVNRLSLPLTKTFMSAISVPLALVLTLIFLPDLRRSFQKNEPRKLLSLFKTHAEEVSHALVDAVIEMARLRCGALIVFPGSDDLSSVLSGGEEYDARVTKSLLLSIFNTRSPRHDGAIIVHNNRILRAGAVLPLSSAEHGDEEWGTRHLAAVGITELSDATSLVVSEQRGTISVAHGGEMKVVVDADFEHVSAEIAHALHPDGKQEQKVRLWGFSAALWVAAILFSLAVFALTSWLDRPIQPIRSDEFFIMSQAPVRFKNIPENLYLEEYSVDTCRVSLRLPAEEVNVYSPNLELTVDLSDSPVGASEFQFTERNLSGLPENWKVSRFNPETILFVLAESRRLALTVSPQFTALRSGLKVKSVSITPSELLVEAQETLSEQGRELHTLPINLSRIAQPGQYRYESFLDLPPTIHLANDEKEGRVSVDVIIEGSQ